MESLQLMYQRISENLGSYLPKAAGALVILLAGWVIARLLAAGARVLIRKANFAGRFERLAGHPLSGTTDESLSEGLGTGIYYLIMLFVLIAFFEALGLTLITEPINDLLAPVMSFVPNLLGAGLILLVAWGLAFLVRLLTIKALTALGADHRFASLIQQEEGEQLPLSAIAGNLVFAFVFLLFLPGVFGAISTEALGGILQPVQALLDKILTFIPNLIAAAIILLIAWIVARIVRQLVTVLLASLGADQIGEKAGIGEWKISAIGGTLVYALILVPALTSALETLHLDSVTAPFNNMLMLAMEKLPGILSAVLLVFVGYFVARLARRFVSDLSANAGADTLGEKVGAGRLNISGFLGGLVFLLILIPIITSALDILSLDAVTAPISNLLNIIMTTLPSVVTAAFILTIGVFIARLVRNLATDVTAKAGLDDFASRLGLAEAKLSSVVGMLLYVLILLPIISSSLDVLGIEAVARPVSDMLNIILAKLPAITTALIILAVSYYLGRLVARLLAEMLAGLGLNSLPAKLGLGALFPTETTEGQQICGRSLADLTGWLVFAGIMLFAVIEAAELLEFHVISDLAADFTVFAGQILGGLVILAIGLYLSRMAAMTIKGTAMTNSGLLAMVAQTAIIALSFAMAFDQMGIASETINLTFGLLLGAFAVAAALAFGLGGREAAGRLLEDLRTKK